eukprot:123024-Pyramimonas_sp.AAC.1
MGQPSNPRRTSVASSGATRSFSEPSDEGYAGDLSRKALLTDLTQEARMEDVKFIDRIGLWGVLHRPSGAKAIDARRGDVD